MNSVYSATDEYSGVYRVLLDKGSLYMYQNMPSSNYPQIVMFGPFTCNYLLRFCNNLDKMHTYVVIDPSLKRIKRLQDYLIETDLQLIFITGGISEIPLRKDSIDIYIDHPDDPAGKLSSGKYNERQMSPASIVGGAEAPGARCRRSLRPRRASTSGAPLRLKGEHGEGQLH